MKILFCSVPFRPHVGGIETVSLILAERFRQLGHEVILVTQTSWDGVDEETYQVVRRPSAFKLLRLVKWADVVFHNNIGMRFAWPLLLFRKPWVVAHHTWIPRSGPGALAGRVKHFAVRFARNISVSRAMAESLSVPSTIIPNPYADDVFALCPEIEKERDMVFLGRLVSDKGVPILFAAMALLKERGLQPDLTLIGTGSEEQSLRALAGKLDISQQVEFVGKKTGQDLVRTLNRHRIMVVPSLWEEPFGVVALEAIACGCVPVVAQSGGLPDAIGPCGPVFPKGDYNALAENIERLLRAPSLLNTYRSHAALHLARHTRDKLALEYLKVLEDANRSSDPSRHA